MTITTPSPAAIATARADGPRSDRRSGLARQRVADAMSARIITCDPATSLRAVAALMADARIHCVVVEDRQDPDLPAWGIVSDLDLVAAGASGATGRTAAQTAATEVITVATGDTLEHAAQLMAEHDLAHLVAVDRRTGRPAGILSTLDVAAALAVPGA